MARAEEGPVPTCSAPEQGPSLVCGPGTTLWWRTGQAECTLGRPCPATGCSGSAWLCVRLSGTPGGPEGGLLCVNFSTWISNNLWMDTAAPVVRWCLCVCAAPYLRYPWRWRSAVCSTPGSCCFSRSPGTDHTPPGSRPASTGHILSVRRKVKIKHEHVTSGDLWVCWYPCHT